MVASARTMAQPKHALFFVYVWPEPLSSAAGVRTRELMCALQSAGWQITATSPSGDSKYQQELNALHVATITADPNHSSTTDSNLASLNPQLVIYDRFVMEEQFGWRARTLWPNALHVVDTQDLHSVRRARERLAQQGAPEEKILAPSFADLGEDLLRELASLYRADGALVVSTWERDFLTQQLHFPPAKLLCLPFSTEIESNPISFAERRGFCFLGNFRHPPNLDSVRWLLKEIWPKIRAELPQAELHLYGAYPPAEVSRFKGENGVHAHGPVQNHRAALAQHRVLLAPLRFGAGIKGKVLEAWGTGTVVAGTALTFEGMGTINQTTASDPNAFSKLAVELHENEQLCTQAQHAAFTLSRENFHRESLANTFLNFVSQNLSQLPQTREANLLGRILCHQHNNATKYFSRWIEAKNQRA